MYIFFCYLSFLLSWFRCRPYIIPMAMDYGLWAMSINILLPLDSIILTIILELSISPVTLCEWQTKTSHSNTFSWLLKKTRTTSQRSCRLVVTLEKSIWISRLLSTVLPYIWNPFSYKVNHKFFHPYQEFPFSLSREVMKYLLFALNG